MGRPERYSFGEVRMTLAGQTLAIPNLRPLFQHWPQNVNPALGRLQEAVLDSLEKFALNPHHRQSLIEANVAHFTVNCWPDADFETLNFMANMVLWAWLIEGYTDKLSADEEAAHTLRSEAKSTWSSFLRLYNHDGAGCTGFKEPLQFPLVASFNPIAARLCQVFDRVLAGYRAIIEVPSTECRQLLLDELFTYLDGTELEAKMRRSGQMPPYDRYLSMRASANGSGFFLLVSGLHKLAAAGHTALGKSTRWMELKKIAATINFLVNDLLSAKKEFETDEYLNSIILRAYDLGSVDASVAECVARVKGLVQEFDHQAQTILADTPQVDNAHSSVAGAIEAMRSFNVGSLEWRQAAHPPKQTFRLASWD
ncbi:hypothetical protein PG993_009317 [Apiospora rasikravindrae]|uniref:Terpene synthase n=1 Tax=Apiospora rasikravindrae TaxID=990691 RepID=A0ABR1SJ17_9PEZI